MNLENASSVLKDTAERFQDIPPTILFKTDASLRGIRATDSAEVLALKNGYLFETTNGGKKKYILDGFFTSDGLNLEKPRFPGESSQSKDQDIRLEGSSPYVLDTIDDQFWIFENNKPVEQVFLSSYAEYYGKKTSRGTPMEEVVSVVPNGCLTVDVYGYCHFWKEGIPCKYCSLVGDYIKGGSKQTEESLQDITETITEALKEKGRWQGFRVTAGSDPRGETPYDYEADEYLKVMGAIERGAGTKDLNCRLVVSALGKEHWKKLKAAGVSAVEPHLEVWDRKMFAEICPGKNKYNGYDYWWDSALNAVEIYGRGNVCNQVVGGAELAKPYGFKTIEEGLESTLTGAEIMAQHGVSTTLCVLWVRKPSVFYREGQTPPSLEYYARLTRGLYELRKKYHIPVGFNDYRRCGHVDSSLSRLDYPYITV
ncbi:putative radical SAM domain protein [Treponema primitia ZAS-2]|uniref:Putative radical SAM domain protein n=1 Tax=Treponema primitia (strain ATCC BAA-887 / DSM 12427 / ZAS-2) TaxID=545694 RepID=F5YMF4_TREPZ|nr:radical SAM protein [Treponema primitia]AEF85561.1 putative radical SAM domain protein [Treponema primitia ZAS-2]